MTERRRHHLALERVQVEKGSKNYDLEAAHTQSGRQTKAWPSWWFVLVQADHKRVNVVETQRYAGRRCGVGVANGGRAVHVARQV